MNSAGISTTLPWSRRLRRPIVGALALAIAGASAFAIAAPAQAEAAGLTSFTAGDLAVYRVGNGGSALSGTTVPVFLDEYAPDGTLVGSVALPTADSGSNHALTASGSAASEGLLTLSGDGKYLVASGYDTPPGTTKISSSAAATVPRTVGLVDASTNIDTSTALTDWADANNPRSAASSNGTDIWVGGAAGGVRYATKGASTSTEIVNNTYKNVREVSVVNGSLVTSADPTKAGVTVASVGTGLPTTGSLTPANLNFDTVPGDPYGYAFVTLGAGTAPDTLYEADLTAGELVKYSLTDGTWTQSGQVPVANADGVSANDVNGVVTVYVTSNGANGTSGTLYKVTDDSGAGGSLSGTATQIATAPTNEAFRGVAFTPGTVFGTGGPAPIVKPTVTSDQNSLAAALGDPTNPALDFTIGDANYAADQLTVSTSSSNTTVAADHGITIGGTGADRTLTITPAGGVGISQISITVTAPDQTSTTLAISYGVSADLGNSAMRYYAGAGNASAAVDAGGGYALVADDESNVVRLYNLAKSGPPVKTFDFSADLPIAGEIDLESATRAGNLIYWEGSMSTTSSGNLAPARSTMFTTTITGSGADTELTYAGAYNGLLQDLTDWDHANNDALGLQASAAQGTDGHAETALNVEGLEFAPGSTSTAYLGFRAPLEPTNDRHLAMLIPVTNFDKLTSGAHATFGSPIFLDLGGLGVRDIRRNADGQYLIIAGTADDANSGFVLYTWDGNPAAPAVRTGTSLPQLPSADNLGAWETIVSVPEPLIPGAPFELIQDDGDVVFYADGLTSKTGTATDLQKDLGMPFTYTLSAAQSGTGFVPPAAAPTTGGLTVSPSTVTAGQTITVTGGGFTAGETVHLDVYSSPTVLGTTVAGADGTITATVTIPASLPAGSHTVAAYGAALTLSGALTVTAAGASGSDSSGTSGAAGTSGSSTELASTGENVFGQLGFAGLLLLLGAGAVAGANFRRRAVTGTIGK